MSKISIITVSYNAAATIETAIKSVISQKNADIEYLIIDGASEDQTLEIIEFYKQDISAVISEPDKGLYHAMNKGIEKASGDYIYFLNADDYLVNDSVISSVKDFLVHRPYFDVVYGNLQVRYPHREPSLHRPPSPEKILDELICGALPHQATFARRSILQEMGGFNENYKVSADYDWFLRLAERPNTKIAYMPITVASYAINGQSSQMTKVLPEVYQIQNQFPIYQTPEWKSRRISAYQNQIIELTKREAEWLDIFVELFDENYEKIDIKDFFAQLQAARATIESMKTSKFWTLRRKWFQFKKILGLSQESE